jgi:hypothetical protein
MFEQLSDTNFDKCDLVPINIEKEDIQQVDQSLCYNLNELPVKNFGLPLHISKLRKEDMEPLEGSILKRMHVGGEDYFRLQLG